MSTARGLPDRNVLSVPEIVDCAWCVRRSSALPIVVDIDNGLGTLDSARRAVRELQAVGVRGVCIEDNAYPKRNSLIEAEDRHLLSTSEFVEILRACRDALEGSGTRLIARTEALIAGAGIDVALERATAYHEAGAETIVFHSVDRSGEEALAVGRAWQDRCPLLAIPTAFPSIDRRSLGRAGYAGVIYANQVLRGVIRSSQLAAAALVTASSEERAALDVISVDEVFALVEGAVLWTRPDDRPKPQVRPLEW
jgi:phosphoenolpyruvate phosphomutase